MRFPTQKKKWFTFLIGFMVSVLFLVFCIPLYEMMYYEPEFSNEMYNQNMYFVAAAFTVLLNWAFVSIFFLLWDPVDKRFTKWLIMLVVTLIFTPVVVFIYPDGEFASQNLDFSLQLKNFNIINVVVAFVLYIINSVAINCFSSNAEFI